MQLKSLFLGSIMYVKIKMKVQFSNYMKIEM